MRPGTPNPSIARVISVVRLCAAVDSSQQRFAERGGAETSMRPMLDDPVRDYLCANRLRQPSEQKK